MSSLVADASALVSLGTVSGDTPDPLSICLDRYKVVVPTAVIADLREIASYDDVHGHAATTVLELTDAVQTRSVDFDDEFPPLMMAKTPL